MHVFARALPAAILALPALVPASQFTVQATVVDLLGRPATNTRFMVMNDATGDKWHAVTDENGRFFRSFDSALSVGESHGSAASLLEVNRSGIRCVTGGAGRLTVYNVAGQIVQSSAVKGGHARFSLPAELGSGVYFVTLSTADFRAVSRVTLVDGAIIGSLTQGKGLTGGVVGRPATDSFFLECADGRYDGRVPIPQGSFNSHSDTARLNMVPRLVGSLPGEIGAGFDLSKYVQDDGTGLWVSNNGLVKVVGGMVLPVNPAQSVDAATNFSYKDAINPSLEVVANSRVKHDGSTVISGKLIDTDTWEHNPILQGWVSRVPGDTVLTNSSGRYALVVPRGASIDSIAAGYKDSDGKPASFIHTLRNVPNADSEGLDVAVVTYLNLGQGTQYQVTPDLFRVMMYECNFGPTGNDNYDGAKALREDMVWHLSKKGRYAEFTREQFTRLRATVDSINSYLKNPLPVVEDTSGWYPLKVEDISGKILIHRRFDAGAGSIGNKDIDIDGRVDAVYIALLDPIILPNAVWEECASALSGFDEVHDIRLKDRTIFYEWGQDVITPADIKSFRVVEGITHNLGYLRPKMSINDVLRIQ